jgi:hypothetical protein
MNKKENNKRTTAKTENLTKPLLPVINAQNAHFIPSVEIQ